jgi:uncharacterized membrane protein YheB (UPF0754 family)
MNGIWIVLVTVIVAALIGGITNHLAIKMLFHPRNPIYIANKRLWFTPGIIPKRKSEIAKSLGRVVSQYLVTTEGLTSVLRKPQFRTQLEDKLRGWIERFAGNEETLRDWISHYWTEEKVDSMLNKWKKWSGYWVERGVLWLWVDKGWGGKPIKELIPDWNGEKKEAVVSKAAGYITAAVRQELLTPQGQKLLRRLINQFLDQTGGLFGTLAGIFMDEEKMLIKVQTVVIERLNSVAVQQALHDFLQKQVSQLEDMTLSELLEQMGQEHPEKLIIEWAKGALKWDQWFEQTGALQIKQIVGPKEDWLIARVPWLIEKALQFAEGRLEQTVQAIKLPELVQEQVENFPIERLEDIILSVSGKEFRAITWLGAVLGGMIGLAQSLFFILYR